MLRTIAALLLVGLVAVPAAAQDLVYEVDVAALARAANRFNVDPVREIVGASPVVEPTADGVRVVPDAADLPRVEAALQSATAPTYGFLPADVARMTEAGVWDVVAARMDELGVPATQGLTVKREGDAFLITAEAAPLDVTLADWGQRYLELRTGRVVGLTTVEPAPGNRFVVRSLLGTAAARAALDARAQLSIHRVVAEGSPGALSVPVDPAMMDDAQTMALAPEAIVTGADLLVAEPLSDPTGAGEVVSMVLTDDGAAKFAAATAASVGLPLAIVLDGEVISAPTVQTPITAGFIQIAGAMGDETTETFAARLQSAADPGAIRRVP